MSPGRLSDLSLFFVFAVRGRCPDAVGVRIYEVPITPEKLLTLIKEKEAKETKKKK